MASNVFILDTLWDDDSHSITTSFWRRLRPDVGTDGWSPFFPPWKNCHWISETPKVFTLWTVLVSPLYPNEKSFNPRNIPKITHKILENYCIQYPLKVAMDYQKDQLWGNPRKYPIILTIPNISYMIPSIFPLYSCIYYYYYIILYITNYIAKQMDGA
jgi:hypothetical protein